MKVRKTTPNGENDFIWRFSLEKPANPCRYDDPLVEMVRAFFADFLDMGFFTKDGKRVEVDGFVFSSQSETVYRVFPDDEPVRKT